ncbi:DUF6298 domain-containing protein [Proteiniphilum sp. UBA1028]|jgi:hypothetical protein|uniref:DUF6298 domain-containing protein n=1 Tax=Proteiniphilum sp. UBA1028 TaxID=1947251 RepID=UPI0025F629B5|nr:DUF6298 domain-containing protein [Proteiniphilum sp. UBA1028]
MRKVNQINKWWRLSLWLLLPLAPVTSDAHFKTTPNSPVQVHEDGTLTYRKAANGDRVPDYSYCGYHASEAAIPDVKVKVLVPLIKGDATTQIQQAIDYVSSLAPDKDGFRGTILLQKGNYRISGSLVIRTSGVVLRGSGSDEAGTVLYAVGNDRETLIRITGAGNRVTGPPVEVDEKYFPVNTTQLTFAKGHPFRVGDKVLVNRPSTGEWIRIIGADRIGAYVDYPLTVWKEGDFDQNWYREIVAVTPRSVTLDVPLTNALDPDYGGGYLARYEWPGLISRVGVENLRCISEHDTSNPKDENHRWMAITLEHVRDAWVRRVVTQHFVSSSVAVWETASRITVEDCKSLAPVGEIGNYRRYAFQTLGQQVLFQRCYAEYAWHAYSAGFTTPGPNAFVQCFSYMPYNFSGAVGGWATGILFDKMTVDGGTISFGYRDVDGQGGGWSAANSMSWQCRAAQILLDAPPGAQNWAYGSWAQGYGNGHHELEHTFIKPESFFYAQLKARRGRRSVEEDKIRVYNSSETTAPSFAQTAQLSELARHPDLTMFEWIDRMIEQYPIQEDYSEAVMLSDVAYMKPALPIKKGTPLQLSNGRLLLDDKVATGKRTRTSLWRGSTRPGDIAAAGPNLVRFVPGRIGRGLTDDLDTVVADMVKQNIRVMQSFPALWYERRRDDHARSRRADADVWAPFYEQPFSRSGQGEAYDRLSKYDLTRWNDWYWRRLRRFADLADQQGRIYIEEHYLQHNIIEEGAHWTDYPWRTANNINGLDFPEHPAYAGDKRIFMAEQFYDTTRVKLNSIQKAYIRKSLDNFKGNSNILHHLGVEYTGPLHFAQFWLDVIAEWEKENRQEVLVMLPGTKDVQDAILNDPVRSRIVDVIDVIQWQYRDDGTLYAPPGGVSLAPRQYVRIMEKGNTSFGQIHRAVSELHARYPEKAVIYSADRNVRYAEWAVFMGGGSLAAIPRVADPDFLRAAARMKPSVQIVDGMPQYLLGRKGNGYIVFSNRPSFSIDLGKDSHPYKLVWIHPESGETIHTGELVEGGGKIEVRAPFENEAVAWLCLQNQNACQE